MNDLERTAGDRLRVNEKLKVGSAVLANVGTALFLSAFGRWFLSGFDAWVAMWIAFGCTIIGVAIQLMSLFEPETVNG
ncbi:MAG TPA: hypothetical protein VF782_07410 [Allosphingosinicella sp.]